MNRKTLDSRDSTPTPKVTRDPLAVLLSSRAVTAAKGAEKDMGGLWRVERGDWVAVV